MPWTTPTLKDVRKLNRDFVTAALGAKSLIPNSVLRIMSDAQAGLASLVLLFIDWLSKQLLPDTAEAEWLDRHGNIWLVNADGSIGRKSATYAAGSVTATGIAGAIVPSGSRLTGANTVQYETTEEAVIGSDDTTLLHIISLTAGTVGNAIEGDILTLSGVEDIDSDAVVVSLTGGTDPESDDLLRSRVLFRIQKPPMGGDADDYVRWTTAFAGVTRAWSYPQEMGIGTCTVRFMMDDLRAGELVITTDTVTGGGYPLAEDILAVMAYLDVKRPCTVKDFFVEAPIPYLYDVTISDLDTDDASVRARIEQAIRDMEADRVKPGQPMYRSWVDEAISGAVGESHHELTFTTTTMPGPGYMARLGTVTYA
jgi:uncharacterized phage protein gp47/JayE